MNPHLLPAVVFSVLVLVPRDGVGALILSDPFDYPVGAIAGRDGGTGFSQPYSGNGQVNAGSLTYTDPDGVAYPGTGNRVSTTTSGGGMFRNISTLNRPPGTLDQNGKFGADGSRIYIAFLERLDSGVVTSFGDYGGISLFDGGVEHLFFGDLGFDGVHRFWGVDPQEGVGATRDSTVLVSSTVRLLIGRIDFAPGGETVRFYIDPPLASEPLTPTIGPFVVHDFRFDRVRLQGGGNGRYGFDQLAVGSSYSDVVPEPSAGAALLSGTTIAFLMRRRNAAGCA